MEFKPWNLKIVWVVRCDCTWCIYEHREDAWADWKSFSGEWRLIYPKIMCAKRWAQLPDFTGW